MKMKNMLIIVFVLAVLSITAFGISKITTVQVTSDISLEDIKDCETFYWDEAIPIYGTCTEYYDATVCDDEPFNTSCHTEQKSYDYRCKTGTQVIQKSREECKDKKIEVAIDKLTKTENYRLEYAEWGKCSYTAEDETLVITCDSKYDGNNDGTCHPGESCIQFRVTKDNIQRLEKNSRYGFIEEDETFFLNKLSMEEVS